MTLPTFWSLVTLPTSLGRVASDPLVFFLWPCSLKNTSHRILFLVVACDPTYLFGRVASDHFLALAIPKHLPWPDLHSDRIWPYSPTCHRKHGFCVAGATISMPLRCSPLTLYMLVGKCQMAFVWQVQQFWCLWDDLPWPYTCLLGRVASDWQWLCVAGAIFSMPPRSTLWPNVWRHWWPYLLFVWKAQNSRWLREVPCVYVLLVWQVQYFRHLREGHRDTARSSPWHYSSVLWQVPSLPPSSSAWPYTFALCGRRNIFRYLRTFFARPGPKGRLWPPPPFCVAGANHWRQWWPYFLFVWQVQYFRCLGEVSRDPISILCGRCTSNPAS